MLSDYKNNLLHRMKIARGHFDKVIKMVESEEYCLNITQQTFAIQQAIKKIDKILLEHHLQTCVRNAMVSDDKVDERIKEIIEVFNRR